MLEPLTKNTIDYLTQFGVTAVYVTVAGGIGAASPAELSRAPVAAAWWARDRRTALAVINAIGQHHPRDIEEATAMILAAAKRLEVSLSCHSNVVARAQAAMAELNSRLSAAQRAGALSAVNAEYRRRRLVAAASGKKFMQYGEVQRRLRVVLAGAVATGSMPELFAAVFDTAGPPRS
jgi:hypothetical protein